MNKEVYEHSRPLDVHRWSEHPEVNSFVDDIFNTYFHKLCLIVFDPLLVA